MTLEPYDGDRIDTLALRIFDCAAAVRALAITARNEGIDAVYLHDKKALEFLARLEEWIHKAEANLQISVRRAQGARRARQSGATSKSGS